MRRLAFLIFFWWPLSLSAQIISTWQVETEQFLFRIKNIEFFINRFNGQNDSIPRKVDPHDSVGYVKFIRDRTSALTSLFDQTRIQDKSQKNFRDKGGRFIQWANDPANQKQLHFEDSSWFAEVQFAGIYLGKPADVVCVLQVKNVPSGGYQWQLLSLRLAAMNLRDKFSGQIVLSPAAHGTDFISLSNQLSNETYIKQTMIKAEYSTILPLILGKKLVVGSVKSIRYHFLQLDGWLVTSEYFNRPSKNSGWLIRDLTEMDGSGKVSYTQSLRGY